MASSATPTPSTTFVAADYTPGPDFQGWYLQTTPQPILCGSTETYYTSSTYADCYNPSTSAPIPTGCDGSTLLRGDQSGVCATYYSCSSYLIFPTEGSSDSEAVVRYGCMVNWGADSIYRTLPARYVTPTSTSTVTPSSSTASPTTTTTQPTTTTTNTSSTPQVTTGTFSSSSSSDNGLSGGAIAGIVIGCIAAIVILALLIFRKRLITLFKNDKFASDSEPTPSLGYAPSQSQSMSQSNSTWHPSELSSGEQHVHEIGSSQAGRPVAVHELG